MTTLPVLSVVVPVYGNESSMQLLVAELDRLNDRIGGGLQGVFVIDASPDRSRSMLSTALKTATFGAVIVDHSRNFGSFAAIRTGMGFATGEYIGVMAADLQEPPELMDQFLEILQTSDVQVAIGERTSRTGDRRRDRVAANAFWRLYRRFVLPSMPEGGVDVFACTSAVRDQLLEFREANSSLVGLLFWLGYRTRAVPYDRRARADDGSSSWTFAKKFRYMMDSIYSFTDLPLRLLRMIGSLGLVASLVVAVAVAVARWRGAIHVAGYTPLILALSISTMLILSALGIVGSYVWRAYENTKRRPLSVVERIESIERRE
ncbi:MAG: glycosyl transferase [Ilumatobacteraceae bacterium]|nr:glycosyl transferase [Ilumatobacteraceae bacterium]